MGNLSKEVRHRKGLKKYRRQDYRKYLLRAGTDNDRRGGLQYIGVLYIANQTLMATARQGIFPCINNKYRGSSPYFQISVFVQLDCIEGATCSYHRIDIYEFLAWCLSLNYDLSHADIAIIVITR